MRSLHESEASRAIVFVGGTALRFLENLPRFSEDLDFSQVSFDGYEPVSWLRKLKRDLHLAGFDSTVRWIDRKRCRSPGFEPRRCWRKRACRPSGAEALHQD